MGAVPADSEQPQGPQPCASCGQHAHIVMKDGRRLCARCYRAAKDSGATQDH